MRDLQIQMCLFKFGIKYLVRFEVKHQLFTGLNYNLTNVGLLLYLGKVLVTVCVETFNILKIVKLVS